VGQVAEARGVHPWSRRAFAGGASALLTGLLAASARSQASPSSSPPASEASPEAPGESTSLKTQTDVGRLVTQVFVDGKGPYGFLVDTGAERSVVADSLVAELGLTPTGRANVQGLILKVPTDLVTLGELRYGSFTRQDLVVPVLPRALLGVDGYLGLDIINDTRITFAFKAQSIRIEKPGGRLRTDRDVTVVVIHGTGKGGRLRSNLCLVDGVRATAFIDTGSESTIGNMALLDALPAVDHPNLGPATLEGATGGEASGRLTPVKRIELQNLIFQNGVVVMSDVPDFDRWGISTRPAILIGMDYLRKFASVTIDYRHKEITFELANASPDTHPPKVTVT
jgi:hypothetical protein